MATSPEDEQSRSLADFGEELNTVNPSTPGGKRIDLCPPDLKALGGRGIGLPVPGKNSEGATPYYTFLPRMIDELQDYPSLLAMVIDMMTPEELEAYANSLQDVPEAEN